MMVGCLVVKAFVLHVYKCQWLSELALLHSLMKQKHANQTCHYNYMLYILLKVCGTGTILGVCSPCFCFGKTIRIRSLPDFVMAWALPKFSLKCIAAIINL